MEGGSTMIRNNILTRTIIGAFVVVLAAPIGVFAQTGPKKQTAQSNENAQTFSRAELAQMVAPIAQYPDSLLAQVLIAATYPSQVAEADQWVKENKGLSKDQLNAAMDKKDWDPSVKALAAYPQILAMMEEHSDWTTNLGKAFLAQQKEVLASIQELRHKTFAKGNLKTNLNGPKGSTHSQAKTSHKTQTAKKYSHKHYRRRNYASDRDYYQEPGLSIDTPFFDINIP
jgi:hypothetical protein